MKKNIIATLIIMTAICAGCEKGESNTEKYTGKPNKTEVAVDAVGMAEMDVSYNTIQELMVDADYVVYAEIENYSYAVESGSVSTNETVRVIDSLYGNIKEGEKISVFKMGGYVKIQDYINSYEEEFREQVKNSATFENLTKDDIQNKYISFLPEGEVETDIGSKAIYFLKQRDEQPGVYVRVGAYEGEYVELSDGDFKVPGMEDYEEINNMTMADGDDMEGMENCIISWNEIVEQIN